MGQGVTGLRTKLNLKSAAAYVGVCIGVLRRELKSENKPAHYKIGKRYFFNPEDLDSWVENSKKQ